MKRWKDNVITGVLIVLLPLLVLAKIVFFFFEKPLDRSPGEMAELMEQTLAGDDMAWDRLISIPVANPRLEAIRKQCLNLKSEPEIRETLSGFIHDLRSA